MAVSHLAVVQLGRQTSRKLGLSLPQMDLDMFVTRPTEKVVNKK